MGLARRGTLSQFLALVLIAGLFSTPFRAWHSGFEMADWCEPSLVTHDASKHRFETGTQDETGREQHCDLCHWGRSLRSAILVRLTIGCGDTSVSKVQASRLLPPPAPLAIQVPGRSPPTVLL